MKMQSKATEIYEINYHLVWCTKFRRKALVDAAEVVCRHIIGQTCAAYEWKVKNIDIRPDYVSLVVSCDPETSPGEIVRTLKTVSAIQLFSQFPKLRGEKSWSSGLWSTSTYYGTVGDVTEKEVQRYVESQKQRG